jgi:hypothetical protein
VAKAARELWKDKGRGTTKSAEWSKSEGLLMFRSKIYVPENRELMCCIVEQHHNTCITGHVGHFKTLELVSCNYWWPQKSRYIGSMSTPVICTTGQRRNVNDLLVSSTLQKHLRYDQH